MLDERGVDYTIRDDVTDPLDRTQLSELVEMVGGDPADMVRADLGTPSADEVVAHLVDNPADMQRPIAALGGRAVIGRPFDRVLEVLD